MMADVEDLCKTCVGRDSYYCDVAICRYVMDDEDRIAEEGGDDDRD